MLPEILSEPANAHVDRGIRAQGLAIRLMNLPSGWSNGRAAADTLSHRSVLFSSSKLMHREWACQFQKKRVNCWVVLFCFGFVLFWFESPRVNISCGPSDIATCLHRSAVNRWGLMDENGKRARQISPKAYNSIP